MKQMRITYILMAVAALLVASCSSHDDDSVPMQTVTMPIKLAIPAEGFGDPTRATDTEAGDPGTFETFKLPQYLYVFLYSEYDDGTTKRPTVIYKKIDLTAGSSSKDDKQQYVSQYWEKKKADNGDSLYTYNGDLSIDLPLQRTTGKVYVAASYYDLTSGEAKLSTTNGKAVTDLITEDDIKNVCFTVEDRALRNTLQDVYSSPYNYKINNEYYYGTLKDYSSKVPRIDMVLYHVAARVDISWNVAADTEAATLDLQKELKITFQEPRKNFQTNCLLFRPMENVVKSDNPWPSSGYDLSDLIKMNQGNQWYGRQVYYMIPYKYHYNGSKGPSAYENQLIINWRMVVNNEYNTDKNNATYGKNITIGVDWPDNDVFVPSIRGVIRVKSNFTVNTTSSTD